MAAGIKRYSLALLSSLLLVCSFPKFDVGILAWIALIPLLLSIKNQSPKSAFFVCYLSSIAYLMGVFYWINVIQGVTPLDFLLLGIYLGLYFALFGLSLNLITSKVQISAVYVAPVLWVSLEYIRSHAGFLGLPWSLLGHTQYRTLPAIQIASFAGVYGVSFLIVMVNVALAEAAAHFLLPAGDGRETRHSWQASLLVTFLLFGASLAYGFSALSPGPPAGTVNVTVIQGNVPQGIKWDPAYRKWTLERYSRLTVDANADSGGASLIAWPESTIPGSFRHDLELSRAIPGLAARAKTSLLFGSAQMPKLGRRDPTGMTWFNSAFLLDPEGQVQGQYDKIHLLPFGEYLPYRGVFPWPSRFSSKAGYFTPGEEYKIFRLGGVRFGALICWETIFPDLAREFVKNGAQFLVNMTNEAWFGDTAAPYQFVMMNVFRAVENRVSIARAANTGVSCFIGPTGEILGRVMGGGKDIFVEGHLTMTIPISREQTFYTRHGDVFAYGNLGFAGLYLAACIMKWGRNRPAMGILLT